MSELVLGRSELAEVVEADLVSGLAVALEKACKEVAGRTNEGFTFQDLIFARSFTYAPDFGV